MLQGVDLKGMAEDMFDKRLVENFDTRNLDK